MDAINPNTRRSYKYRRKWGTGGKEAFEKGDRSGGQEAFIDLFNRLAAKYGAAVTDGMIGDGVTPFAFIRAATLIQDDLDLWFEATGQRVSQFIGAERQALECWLWETHDRQLDRSKPKKSSRQDAPWSGARNWSPRRWFPFPENSPEWGRPLQIAVAPSPWEPRTSAEAWKWRWPTSPRELRRLLRQIRRLRTQAPRGYWSGVKNRPVTRGLAAMQRRLCDADDLDRLALSVAIEAA